MARVRPIREIAEPMGYNISTLARKADLSYPTMHALWHGHVVRVDLNTLEAVARVLGMRTGDLIIDTSEVREEQDKGQWVPGLEAVLASETL